QIPASLRGRIGRLSSPCEERQFGANARPETRFCKPTTDRPHSALMFAARITLPHFSVSSAINLTKSAGEPGSTVPPQAANRDFILGSARAALISAWSLSTISAGGVLWGPSPHHP